MREELEALWRVVQVAEMPEQTRTKLAMRVRKLELEFENFVEERCQKIS